MGNYFRNIGKALMMPIAVLPAAAILVGIGNWMIAGNIAPVVANILLTAGVAIINNIAVLFAIGLAYGMSKDRNGSAALAGLVMWLVVTNLLDPTNLVNILGIKVGADQDTVTALGKSIGSTNALSFTNINNAFIGISVGVMSAEIYNKFHTVELPRALSFFSGRRLVSIITASVGVVFSIILYFLWPFLFTGLVNFGEFIVGLGPIGAGLYGFFNRLLIPTGLHHALNSVFWFDVANINDIGNYLGCTAQNFNAVTQTCAITSADGKTTTDVTRGVVGMYQAGFFPIMMFGLPGAALAIYHTALPENKKKVGSIMLAGAFAAFFTGVTEPLEFSFMFVAWPLYVLHAALTGFSLFLAATFHFVDGFAFSAGLVDFVLNASNPLAVRPYMLLIQGLIFGVLYYFLFKFAILKFKLNTPGRTPNEYAEENEEEIDASDSGKTVHTVKATKMLAIIGEDNLVNIDNCATRLRLEVKNSENIDEGKLKKAGALGVIKPDEKSIQIIIGPEVEFVAEALKKISK